MFPDRKNSSMGKGKLHPTIAFRTNRGFFLLFMLVFHSDVISCGEGYQDEEYTLAYVNVSYYDPVNRRLKWEREATVGKYGQGKIGAVEGVLVHVRNKQHRNGNSNNLTEVGWSSRVVHVHSGCEANFEDDNIPKGEEQWIGLIRKGHCSIAEKILNAANNNATAVIIYDDEIGPIQKMHHRVPNIVSILIARDKGERLAKLADTMSINGTSWVRVSISVGAHQTVRLTNINKTSVLFVSVSFIVLMVISLAWLIFYYIQRFRYINVKDQLAKRLSGAAKKALNKIPLKTVKESEPESECCAVCIEPYSINDVLRVLPCSHEFHRLCVDPWLLDHRTCPCCKLDILKYFGLVQTPLENEFHLEANEASRFNGNSADQRPTSSIIQLGATSSHSTAINAYDQRFKSLTQAPDFVSSHQAVVPSVEAIKIAILENSPMASRNLRCTDRALYVTLEPLGGPT